MKNFLDLGQFETDELKGLLDLADRLKFERNNRIAHPHLRGQTLGVISSPPEPEMRTALCTGMYELGGTTAPVDIDGVVSSMKADAAAMLAKCCSGLALFGFGSQDAEKTAKLAGIPVINIAGEKTSPVFVLSLLMTVREKKGSLSGLKLCYIDGDSRGSDSLIYAAISCGMKVSIAAPLGFRPDDSVVDWGLRGRKLELTSDPMKAAVNADVICTGIRAPGTAPDETGAGDYRVGSKITGSIEKELFVFHARPAFRGGEISERVYQAHREDMLSEAENRLHVIKAVLTKTMKK